MEQNEKSPKDNFKNALCYVPLVAILLFFVEQNKSKELYRNIKYGIYLIGIYFIFSILFGIVLFFLPIGFLLFLAYIGLSFYYGYKAYNGDEIRIEILDKLDDKINSNNKPN